MVRLVINFILACHDWIYLLLLLAILDAKSVVRLGATCKQMDQFCRTESVWQRLVRRDFKRAERRSFVTSWREFYKVLVEERKAQAEVQTRLLSSQGPPFFSRQFLDNLPNS